MREQNGVNRADRNDGGRRMRLRLENSADWGANQRDVTGSREQLLSRPLRNFAAPRQPRLKLHLYDNTVVAIALYSNIWCR